MSKSLSMAEIALIIKEFDAELREALQTGRSGIFRRAGGDLYLRKDVPLGQGYSEEVLGIFADVMDLEFFYKLYLDKD